MGIILRFGTEALEVIDIDRLRRHVLIRKGVPSVLEETKFEWKNFKQSVAEERYKQYGLSRRGRFELIKEVRPAEVVKARLDRYMKDFLPDFDGTVTIVDGHWGVMEQRRGPGIDRHHVAWVVKWTRSEFHALTGTRGITKPIVWTPFTDTLCPMGEDGEALVTTVWFVAFIQEYMGMLADPFAWKDYSRNGVIMGQEILLGED